MSSKFYKVACPSRCGTYFQHYLQFVIVKADNADEAIFNTERWLHQEGEKFVGGRSEWLIEELDADSYNPVLYSHWDSDY